MRRRVNQLSPLNLLSWKGSWATLDQLPVTVSLTGHVVDFCVILVFKILLYLVTVKFLASLLYLYNSDPKIIRRFTVVLNSPAESRALEIC